MTICAILMLFIRLNIALCALIYILYIFNNMYTLFYFDRVRLSMKVKVEAWKT